jgi:DNA-binding transcriptional MerR regulator
MNSATGRLASRDIAEIIGVETVTVRKYALALEKAGYLFERSDSDHRLFSDKDVIIMQHLRTLRERSGMSVETAAKAISTRHREISNSVTLSLNTYNTPDKSRYDILEEKIENLTRLLISQQAAAKTFEISFDSGGLRDIHVNIRITERRIERQLRFEAENAWMNQPMSKRFRGIGFLKRENNTERDKFIIDYIDTHFESRMKQEFEKSAFDV